VQQNLLTAIKISCGLMECTNCYLVSGASSNNVFKLSFSWVGLGCMDARLDHHPVTRGSLYTACAWQGWSQAFMQFLSCHNCIRVIVFAAPESAFIPKVIWITRIDVGRWHASAFMTCAVCSQWLWVYVPLFSCHSVSDCWWIGVLLSFLYCSLGWWMYTYGLLSLLYNLFCQYGLYCTIDSCC